MNPVAEHIKDYLKQQHLEGKEYVMGGHIEDYMRTKLGTKGETASRICRFMVKYGQIEPVYVPRKKGKANVAYKIKDERPVSVKNTEEVRYPSQDRGEAYSGLQVRAMF